MFFRTAWDHEDSEEEEEDSEEEEGGWREEGGGRREEASMSKTIPRALLRLLALHRTPYYSGLLSPS